MRLSLGHSYNILTQQSGDVFGTLILQPGDRVRTRTDITYSTQGLGIQNVSNDVTVRYDPVTVGFGTRYNDPGNFNFLVTSLGFDITRFLTVHNTNNYDMRSGRFIESRVSAELKLDCWSLAFEYVRSQGKDDELRFAVNLLGVGGPIRTSFGLGALGGTGSQ